MFDLKHASLHLKKAAYLQGIRSDRHNAWFSPVSRNDETKAIVGDNRNPDGVEITIFDMEYAAQFSWREIKERLT